VLAGAAERDGRQGILRGQRLDFETCRFKPPYIMADHGTTENGINWIDWHIDYRELHTVLNEAVAGFAHLYAYGVSKCTFFAGLTERLYHNPQDVNCPPPETFNHER